MEPQVLDLSPTADETPVMDAGDSIYLIFWRPFPMPGNPNNGSWDMTTGRFIHAGRKRVTFAIDSPYMPAYAGDGDSPEGSPIRFIAPEFVFASHEAATAKAKTLRPPGL